MTHAVLRRLLVVGIAVILARPEQAVAGDGADPLVWKPEWPTFRVSEYIFTSLAGAASLTAYFALDPPDHPHWTGGILFDDAAREALRVRSPRARDAIRRASDVTAIASVALVVGVDSIVVPVARKNGFVALQLTLMNAEAYSMSTLITTVLFKTTGRARPSYADCQKDPNFDPLCNSAALASFPSGHTNAAFTAAGLACAHHANLSLYGNGVADALACGVAVTLAGATGTFRVMGDRHYASDVLVGAAIGFGVGFAGPTLLHYHVPGESTDATGAVAPMAGPPASGFTVSGVFE